MGRRAASATTYLDLSAPLCLSARVLASVSKVFRSVSALGAVLFALVAVTACGSSGVPGNAVASVDGSAIQKAAFKHWIAVAAISGANGQFSHKPVAPEPPDYTACIDHLEELAKAEKVKKPSSRATLKTQCESQYKSLSQEVLGFLLSSQWVLGEAKSLGVNVSDSEVHKQFVKIRSQQFPSAAEFQKFLASSGQTVSDLLLRVKLNMLSQKIQKKITKEKANVSEAQIQKYYNQNKSRYSTPAKRKLNVVLTKTEAEAKAAKKELESGKSFADVAKAHSIDTTSKSKGGQLEVSKGQQEAALDAAIFSAAKNSLQGPVKTAFGYYVFDVLGETAGSQQSYSQVKQSIKQQLAATGQQSALSKFVKEFKEKWKKKTDCSTGYVVPDCKQYKEPKTGSTGTTATP
jgi:parvulin-like peptidyl-prolyl isomerase